MKNQTNPAIGSSWEALQTKLFSKEEIEASYQRVEKLIQEKMGRAVFFCLNFPKTMKETVKML